MTIADAPLGPVDHVHISRIIDRAVELERRWPGGRHSTERSLGGSVRVTATGPLDYVAIAVDQVGYAWHFDQADAAAVVVTGWSSSALTHRVARLEATARGLMDRHIAYAQEAIDYLDDWRTIDATAADAIKHMHERIRADLEARAGILAPPAYDAGLPADPRCAALVARAREIESQIDRLTWHVRQIVARTAQAYERPGRRYADRAAADTAIRNAVAAERHRDPTGAVGAALAALDQPEPAATTGEAAIPSPPDSPVPPRRTSRRPGRST